MQVKNADRQVWRILINANLSESVDGAVDFRPNFISVDKLKDNSAIK